MDAAVARLEERIRAAAADGRALRIHAGGTKDFYGEALLGDPLDVRDVRGIVAYAPNELVLTARAGTPLEEIEDALAAHAQMLAFEPPRHGGAATLGGVVASGFSGPRRPHAGAARDFVLGTRVIDGTGTSLAFGGQVIKNVAGYDLARLMAGALGVLGVIVEVSLKVMPKPPAQATLRFELDEARALDTVNRWAAQPLPLHASAWWDGMLVVRLAGAHAAVQAAMAQLGGERVPDDMALPFWEGLRDQRDEFFIGAQRAVETGATLWRIAVPGPTPPLNLSGEQLVEWHGGQRWLCTTTPAVTVRQAAAAAGGHATLFRGRDKSAGVFGPLPPALERIHRQMKAQFDPDRLLNPGRLYPGL
jgi:glycolate oxidase FAD binding subunit